MTCSHNYQPSGDSDAFMCIYCGERLTAHEVARYVNLYRPVLALLRRVITMLVGAPELARELDEILQRRF